MPKFRIDSDYFQIHLKDARVPQDALADAWTPEALRRDLAVADGIIGVGTVKNTSVIVDVVTAAASPDLADIGEWDRIIDASIAIPSGKLLLTSPTWETAEMVEVAPGNYRTRVYFGNITAAKAKGSRIRERYTIVLWPGDLLPVQIVVISD